MSSENTNCLKITPDLKKSLGTPFLKFGAPQSTYTEILYLNDSRVKGKFS